MFWSMLFYRYTREITKASLFLSRTSARQIFALNFIFLSFKIENVLLLHR